MPARRRRTLVSYERKTIRKNGDEERFPVPQDGDSFIQEENFECFAHFRRSKLSISSLDASLFPAVRVQVENTSNETNNLDHSHVSSLTELGEPFLKIKFQTE